MTIFDPPPTDFDDGPPTTLDEVPGMVIEIDADDQATPIPGAVPDACTECFVRMLVRIRNDAPPPSTPSEAQSFDRCVATQDGRWALCAGNLMLNINGGTARIYLGPERRGQRLPPPAGMEDRRKIPSPSRPK